MKVPMFKMKSRTGEFPVGGWQFTDPKTGMKFSEGDFKDVVSQIIKHRQANRRVYPPEELVSFDFASVSNELDAFTCSRLKNNDRFCESGEPIPIDLSGLLVIEMSAPCQKCSCKLGYEIICKSCSGRRRTGFYCKDCMSLNPK